MKITDTNNKKFGGDSPFSDSSVREKSKITIKEVYGVDNVNQNENIRKKAIKTNLEKYGVENPLQNQDIINKRKATMVEKYGVENPMQNEEIKRKSRITYNKVMCSNGKMPCSSQQKHLHSVLGGELNYPFDEIVLDIAFPDEKIYIEYDGGGHDYQVKIGQMTEDQFKAREIRRYFFLKNKGWKYIRIKSVNDNLPSDIEIISFIEFAKQYLKDHSWISLDVVKQVVTGSNLNKSIQIKTLLSKKEIFNKYVDQNLNYRF